MDVNDDDDVEEDNEESGGAWANSFGVTVEDG